MNPPEPYTHHFADRLNQSIIQKQTPLVVGLDPRLKQLPTQLLPGTTDDLTQVAIAYSTFCCGIIDVVADLVPAVKPQAAFFEQIGPLGMAALAEVVDHATAKGLQVIMDAKRGDIGSTATAYASAFLGQKPADTHSLFGEDSINSLKVVRQFSWIFKSFIFVENFLR